MSSAHHQLYAGSLDIHRQIVELYPRVEGLRARFRAMHPVSPLIPKPKIGGPRAVDTDRIFCSLMIRAATTKDSIVLLCESGHGEAALALSRVLLENAALIAWQRLGRGRERLETYILFTSVLRERGVNTLAYFREELPHLFDEDEAAHEPDPKHQSVAEAVFQNHDNSWAWFPDPIKPGKLKRVTVAQMLRDVMNRTDPKARTVEYDLMYHEGSEVIHTGPYSLTPLLRRVWARREFFLEPLHSEDSLLMALAISNVSMLVVLKIADEYIGLNLEADIERIVAANQALNESVSE